MAADDRRSLSCGTNLALEADSRPVRFPRIRYLEWARRRFEEAPPAFNLAASGMQAPARAELGLDDAAPLEPFGATAGRHRRLRQLVAAHVGVSPERVGPANATSQAYFVVLAALVEEGDPVLCEWPTYEPLWRSL